MKLRSSNRRFIQQSALLVATLGVLFLSAPASAQLPYSEDFSTTTFRDNGVGQTTADWNTGFQQLLLPQSPSLSGPTFDETTAVEAFGIARQTYAIAIADLDGDGDLDLIDGIRGRSRVYLNRGAGTFGSRVYVFPEGGQTLGLAAGDIDRDGDIDFVEGSFRRRIRLYLNDGSGAEYVVQDVSNRDELSSEVVLVDINGDGFLDIVSSTLDFRRNVIYMNTGDPLQPFGNGGQPGTYIGNNVRESSRHVVAGDLDKDGDTDIVFVNEDTQNPNDNNRAQRNRVFMSELAQGSANTFTTDEIDIPGSDDVDFSMGAALGDLNGDGYLDLVVANYNDGEASKIYLNSASGIPNVNPFTIAAIDFTIAASPSDPALAVAVSLADADKDGDLDIFLVSESGDFRNRIYFNDGTGANFVSIDVGPVGQAPLNITNTGNIAATSSSSSVGDLDGDGDIDWVIGNFDLDHPSGYLQNNVFRNRGTDSATLVQQLRARATSLQVDASGTNSVRLFPSPAEGMVGNKFLNQIDYWVSGDGGVSWKYVFPDSRPVFIGAGTDVRWRADLQSQSPATAAGLAVFQLDIAANTSGPMVATPIGSATVNEGDSVTGLPIVADFIDPDGDEIFHSVVGLPIRSGLRIDPFTGEISGTPANEDALASPISVTIYATDGALSATDNFTLTVINENDAPVIASTPPAGNAVQDALYTYAIFADDPDLNETGMLRFSAPTIPAWLALTDNLDGSATLSGIPGNSDVIGDNSVVLVVTDPGGLTDSQSFVITVDNVNDQPVFVSNPPSGGVTIGAPYTYSIVTSDPDDGETSQLVIAATMKPAWLSLTDNGDGTATLAGTPTAGDAASDNTVTLVVTDPGGLSDSQSFVVNLTDVNVAPEFVTTPVTRATESLRYQYFIRVVDANSDGLTLTAPTLPSWLVFSDNGGGFASLSGTPTSADIGNHFVVLNAQEDAPAPGLTATQQFTITVASSGEGPRIVIIGDIDSKIFQDSNYNDPGATAVDAEDGDLTDQITTESNVVTNIPGIYTVTYTVSDSSGNQAQAQRIVTVVRLPKEPGGVGAGGPYDIFALLLMIALIRVIRMRPSKLSV